MHLRPESPETESGAALVVLTVTLVVLLAFGALAIDAAGAWSQRRQNQGAVDTGAVAGAMQTENVLSAAAMAAAQSEVIRISYESLQPEMAFLEWEAAWGSCADPDKPASFSRNGSTACISFTSNLEEMRVRIPNVEYETHFAKVMGFSSVRTTAIAEVELAIGAVGEILPLGIPASAARGIHICLKTGPNPDDEDPCDGPDSGNFGFLDITQFGSNDVGTSQICTGDTAERLSRNIAQGVDHPIGASAAAAAPIWKDGTLCPDGNMNARPYVLTTETGNMAQALHDGYIDGLPSESLAGRVNRGSNLTSIGSYTVDDTPMWDYLNGNGQAVCGVVTTHDGMIDCLENTWTSLDGVIFEDTIGSSVRWAWVPIFWEETIGSGQTDHWVRQFGPVYIQTTFWKCNNNACRAIHDPGEPLDVNGSLNNAKVEASSAILIPTEALPTALVSNPPGSDGYITYTLSG